MALYGGMSKGERNRIKTGTTVVMTTHHLDEAGRHADRAAALTGALR